MKDNKKGRSCIPQSREAAVAAIAATRDSDKSERRIKKPTRRNEDCRPNKPPCHNK